MELAGRAALFTTMDPFWFLGLRDPSDSMFAQAILESSEKQIDRLLDSLALKIRNQIAEMLNSGS